MVPMSPPNGRMLSPPNRRRRPRRFGLLPRLIGAILLFAVASLNIFGWVIGTGGNDSISRTGSIVALGLIGMAAAVGLRIATRELLGARLAIVVLVAAGLWSFWFGVSDWEFVRTEGGLQQTWWVYRDGAGAELTFGDEAPRINYAGFSLFLATLVVLPLGTLSVAIGRSRPHPA